MDNQNMTYPELRDLFVERNKTQLAKPVSACIVFIVFADSNWPDHHYPLRAAPMRSAATTRLSGRAAAPPACSVPAWMAPTRWFASTGT